MKKSRFFLVLPVAAIAGTAYYNYPKLELVSGFAAKNVASAHFIDGRELADIESGDNDIPLVKLARNTIDDKDHAVASSVYGLKKRTAVFREGLGSVLIDENFDPDAPYLVPRRNQQVTGLPFPYGDREQPLRKFDNVEYDKLKAAVDNAFDVDGQLDKRTRAVVVVYRDQIIGERYAPGFNMNSRILGWSMTKSITATLFGVLQKQRKLDVNSPAPIPQWKNDRRSEITINNLLQMNSGLEWEEQYDRISDATKMLFKSADMTQAQVGKKAIAAPGTRFNYSSGTTNLLSGVLRKQFATHQEYLDFWYSALIDRIGMHSMLIEADMSGNYVGSSYGWATARDWAKFGLLYLHRGNWNGDQVFDENWVDYVTTPTPTSADGYGAHFWLNAGGRFPEAPRDMYSANGFQGQMVFIIPSKELVIVRMGLKEDPLFDFNRFLKEVVESVD